MLRQTVRRLTPAGRLAVAGLAIAAALLALAAILPTRYGFGG